MVIGHDQLQPQLPRQRRLGDGSNAAVDGDEQLIFRRNFAHGFGVQAVALAVPRGDAIGGFRPMGAQRLRENCRRAHAVHIVIAVNDDFRAPLHRPANRLKRRLHAVDRLRLGQIVHRWVQKPPGFLGRMHAAHGQQPRKLRRITGRRQFLPARFLRALDQSQHPSNSFEIEQEALSHPEKAPCKASISV